MPNGVVLGLATAISWGTSDFIARFAISTTGVVRALFAVQMWGAILLTILLFSARDWGHLFDGSWQPGAWGILAGAINTCAMLALYRAFELGKLSVVAPISASYPALTVVLSTLSGERFSPYRALGILAALTGVILVAAGEKFQPPSSTSAVAPHSANPVASQSPSPVRFSNGILWAVAAALGFGILFWLLGTRIIPRTGALATLWVIRVTGTFITLAILLVQKTPLRLKNKRTSAQLYSMGFFDTSAFALSNLGMRIEQVAIVSVLGSLYGAITVVLSALFLRERIAVLQWIGIVSIFCGIILMRR
jgi:drug/metabolite transporter (DMT)-like permease